MASDMVADGEPPAFTADQIVTVFRSRRRPGSEGAYAHLAEAMLAAARDVPGFVDFSTFVGDDGEQVSLVTFASPEAHAAWRDDPAHRAAQRPGAFDRTARPGRRTRRSIVRHSCGA